MTARADDSRLSTVALPRRREAGTPYRIAVVCLGNICRSPIGEVVLSDKLDRAGLADEVEVVSAGTGDWHVGKPMDRRAAGVLAAHGYDPDHHRAKQFESSWFDGYDLILAMDAANLREISTLDPVEESTHEPGRLRMFRDFDPAAEDGDRDIPDPYFGGNEGFDSVLAMVERTASAIVESFVVRAEAR